MPGLCCGKKRGTAPICGCRCGGQPDLQDYCASHTDSRSEPTSRNPSMQAIPSDFCDIDPGFSDRNAAYACDRRVQRCGSSDHCTKSSCGSQRRTIDRCNRVDVGPN